MKISPCYLYKVTLCLKISEFSWHYYIICSNGMVCVIPYMQYMQYIYNNAIYAVMVYAVCVYGSVLVALLILRKQKTD